MSNPILVEVTRGYLVESVHRGSVAIADASGAVRFARGDVLTPICPRSALKPLQALPLVETGAAEAFDLSDEEIALACGSHSGEDMHVSRIAAWLKRIGCGEDDLACGAQPPSYEPAWLEMVKRGESPTRLHHNCSGKHAGFLTVSRHLGAGITGYTSVDHPVQQDVARRLKMLSGEEKLPWVPDGCTAANFCLSLTGFARALARLPGTPGGGRIVGAMIAHPELVAGTGRPCTTLMRACAGTAAVKTGAEGVYAAILPGSGFGVALKFDDGAARAAETAIAGILLGLGAAGEAAKEYAVAPVTDSRGEKIGERRLAQALTHADLAAI
jgi:L-asparaginase II